MYKYLEASGVVLDLQQRNQTRVKSGGSAGFLDLGRMPVSYYIKSANVACVMLSWM